MNFSTPQKVTSTITASDAIEFLRGENRLKVNKLFDGFPPLDASTAKKINLSINVNWLEGKVLEQAACRQYNTALLRQTTFFKVKCEAMPPDKQSAWETYITTCINRPLKKSKKYYNLVKAKSAGVVRHGVGAQIWLTQDDPIPTFVAIEDLRIPTDTECSMENLIWFAVRKRYTPGELATKVFGPNADKGWNRPVIAKILDSYKDQNVAQVNYDWSTSPEKMLELYKQDMGFYMSDAVPTIPVWHFYHLEEPGDDTGWMMKVVPSEFGISGLDKDTFLFDSSKSKKRFVAEELSQLLHIQFGDLSGKTPFTYHAVRSLGFLLMEPCYWQNLTRCRFLQHVWENFNMILRGADPTDRARAQKVELFDRGWMPEGVSIVPREQRHQIDPQLVEYAMSQMKQLMSEASGSYTQDIDTGTAKEQTAFETGVKLNQVNSMMAGILTDVAQQEIFAYMEICRRFCNPKSRNPSVMKFQAKCKKYGIPSEYLDANRWDVIPDIPLGAGNQTIEMTQATQLMSQRAAFSGEAQGEILNLWATAVTNNPRLAQHLAPVGGDTGVNDAQRDAEFAFGTLMQGVPVRMKEGLNPIDQIDTIMGLTAGVCNQIMKSGGVPTTQQVAGLSASLQYVQQLIQHLAEDKSQAQRVKVYSDDIGKLSNEVKGMAQRLQEQQKAGAKESVSLNYKDLPPSVQRQAEAAAGFQPATETDAQVSPEIVKTQQKLAMKNADFMQKTEHNRIAFEQDQAHKAIKTQADIEAEGLKAGVAAAREATKPKPETNGTHAE